MIKRLIIIILCLNILKADDVNFYFENNYIKHNKYEIIEEEKETNIDINKSNFIFNFLIDFKYKDIKTESISSTLYKELNKNNLKEEKNREFYSYEKFDIIGFYIELGYKF